MIPVVTAADRKYLPGVRALYNSFKQHAGPGFEFYAILYDCEAEGINTLPPPQWDVPLPTAEKWPEPSPPMYVRLLLPRLFPHVERSIWLDADCIIVDSIAPLAELSFDEPVAAVHFDDDRYTLGFNVPDVEPELRRLRCPFSGLLVFNHAEWQRQRVTERCEALMYQSYTYRFVVQSVLGLALCGNYHRLPYKWQVFANRSEPIPADARILHWVGGAGLQPWLADMRNAHLWERYA